MSCDDKVLSLLAANYINRNLYKARELPAQPTPAELEPLRQAAAEQLGIAVEDVHYFVRPLKVSQMLYSTSEDHITILMKDGSVRDISDFSELLHSEMVDRRSERYYLLMQRGL